MPMSSDPFSELVELADEAINATMSRQFDLTLKSGSILPLQAIFDTQQQEARSPTGQSNTRAVRAVCEAGTLTVLGHRLNRSDVMGAKVTTPIGPRIVADVDYPDEYSTQLLLGQDGQHIPAAPGGLFPSLT